MIDIRVENITKNYGCGRGVFNVSFEVNKGEIFGYVGTNGSGKTTTIRNIMGFIHPERGHAYIKGLDSWNKSYQIKKYVGYVPGEISFPDVRTGTEFLQIQAKMLKLKNMDYANYLIKKLQLDITAPLKTMSKGMKQKTAIVNALMADPDILILDEPTTGLDPLMRSVFIDIVKAEKAKGKTVFMSSHIFEEIENTCDKVALIGDGKIVNIANLNDIRNYGVRTYKIEFWSNADYVKFQNNKFAIERKKDIYNQLSVNIKNEDINLLFDALKDYNVKFIAEVKYTLEQYFDNYFKGDNGNDK